MSKITTEKSEKILKQYIELRKNTDLNDKQIFQAIAEEFQVGLTTVFDHSKGKIKSSKETQEPSKGISVMELAKAKGISFKEALLSTAPKTGPKMLFIDIENYASEGYFWNGMFDVNIIEVTQRPYVLCFCFKWGVGEDEPVYSVALPDFDLYQEDKTNDYFVIEAARDILDIAEIAIGHNLDKFDQKRLTTQMLFHGLVPNSPTKSIDTLKISRAKFSLNSNKLDEIAKFLDLPGKLPHSGWKLWKACANGCMDSWKTMVDYCAQDILLLEQVYLKFRPFMTNHPNLNLYSETPTNNCRNCGSTQVQRRGKSIMTTGFKIRLHCQSCGAWSTGELIKREPLAVAATTK